jgi:dienelactone hydrolase
VAEVVVFHHALGLTDWMRGFAATLRDAGHSVHTPDVYDGRTFETIPDGMAYSEELGGPMAIVELARAAVEPLSSEVVYVGFSPGAEHYLAEHDEQAAALLEERVLGFVRPW